MTHQYKQAHKVFAGEWFNIYRVDYTHLPALALTIAHPESTVTGTTNIDT